MNISAKVNLVFEPCNNDLMLSSDPLELAIGLLLEQQRMERLLQTDNQPQRSRVVIHGCCGYSLQGRRGRGSSLGVRIRVVLLLALVRSTSPSEPIKGISQIPDPWMYENEPPWLHQREPIRCLEINMADPRYTGAVMILLVAPEILHAEPFDREDDAWQVEFAVGKACGR